MPRHTFGPNVILTADSGTTPPTAKLRAGEAFTVWTDVSGGVDVSGLLVHLDGVTPYTTVATSDGEQPWFRGPDTTDGAEVVMLYLDAGGSSRYPMPAIDVLRDALAAVQTGAVDGGGDTDASLAQQAYDIASTTADTLAAMKVVTVMGAAGMRVWPRTAAQGLPTEADGLAHDDYALVDEA